jgi:hypothetical protein
MRKSIILSSPLWFRLVYIGNVFKVKTPARATLVTIVLALATLGGTTEIGSFLFFVTLLKVARASTVMCHCHWHYQANLRQWKYGFSVPWVEHLPSHSKVEGLSPSATERDNMVARLAKQKLRHSCSFR